MPRISVHLTTFEHEAYLAEAIEGVLAQDLDDWELVIGEDGSPDRTLEIAREYARRDPERVRVLTHPHPADRGRRMYARSLEACTGELVASLDGDDVWTDPSKLRRQVALLEARPEVSATVHALAVLRQDRPGSPRRGRVGGSAPRDYHPRDFIRGVHLPHSSLLFRRALVGTLAPWWHEERLHNPDVAHLLLLAQHGPIAYVPDVHGDYRVHRHSHWSSLPKTEQIERNMESRRVLREAFPGRFEAEIRRYLRRHAAMLVVLHLARGRLERARELLPEALGRGEGRIPGGHDDAFRS